MKNKEIEVMEKYLNGLISYPFQHKDKEYILSYIEQLKVDYKEANESVIWWTNRFNAIERDNRNLKNNRDKAIRTLETLKGSARWERHLYEVDYILNILKGDSDE